MKKIPKSVLSNYQWMFWLGMGILLTLGDIVHLTDGKATFLGFLFIFVIACLPMMGYGYYLFKRHCALTPEMVEEYYAQEKREQETAFKAQNSQTNATYVGGIPGLANNIPVKLQLADNSIFMDGAGTPVKINLDSILGVSTGTEEEIIQKFDLSQKSKVTSGLVKGALFGYLFGPLGAAAGVVSGSSPKTKLNQNEQVKRTIVTVIAFKTQDGELGGISFTHVSNPKFFTVINKEIGQTDLEDRMIEI